MNIPRAMPRFKRRIRVRYRDDGGDKESIALTRDVSPSGLGINATRPACEDAHLHLLIELDGQEPIELRGRVVWARRVPYGLVSVEKGGFGVELTDVDERWYAYLASVAAKAA